MMKIILASSSETRYQLFSRFNLPFQVVAPNLDERVLPDESAPQLASRLAHQKAALIAKNNPNTLIIASDQTCDVSGNILGKPLTKEKAIEQLTFASGKRVLFYTALTTYSSEQQKTLFHLDITTVYFRTLTHLEIKNYLEHEEVLSCAGSFKCEGLGITLFKKIEQNDPTALLGLPLITLNQHLITLGVNPLLYQTNTFR